MYLINCIPGAARLWPSLQRAAPQHTRLRPPDDGARATRAQLGVGRETRQSAGRRLGARAAPARATPACRRPARAAQGPHPRGRQPDLPVLAWPLLPLLRLGPARRPARARCDARRARRLLRQREEEACPPALLEPSRALPRLRADGRQGARLREGVRGVAHLARERAALAGDARAPAEAPARGAGG